MQEYIYTVSKKKFFPTNPNIDDIDISDIAHALSYIPRANGHFKTFHSVAQHSIECCLEAIKRNYTTRVCLACLLHDGAESYMSDVTTPVKDKLDIYKKYEDNLINMIYQKYIGELTDEELSLVYKVDKDLLYHEFYHYTGIELGSKTTIYSNPGFEFEDFLVVKQKFLDLFNELIKKL